MVRNAKANLIIRIKASHWKNGGMPFLIRGKKKDQNRSPVIYRYKA